MMMMTMMMTMTMVVVMMKMMMKRVKRGARKLPLSRVLSDDGVQPLIDTRSAFCTF